VLDSGAVPSLVVLASAADADPEVKNEACWVVLNATSCGSDLQIEYLVAQGCVAVLGDLLGEPSMVLMALEGLERILQVGDDEARRTAHSAHASAANGSSSSNGSSSRGAPGHANPYAALLASSRIEELEAHKSSAVAKRASRIWKAHFVACALCSRAYSKHSAEVRTCAECKCFVCACCNCEVFHLSYQEALWRELESSDLKGKAAAAEAKRTKNKKKKKRADKDKAKKPLEKNGAAASAGKGVGAAGGEAAADGDDGASDDAPEWQALRPPEGLRRQAVRAQLAAAHGGPSAAASGGGKWAVASGQLPPLGPAGSEPPADAKAVGSGRRKRGAAGRDAPASDGWPTGDGARTGVGASSGNGASSGDGGSAVGRGRAGGGAAAVPSAPGSAGGPPAKGAAAGLEASKASKARPGAAAASNGSRGSSSSTQSSGSRTGGSPSSSSSSRGSNSNSSSGGLRTEENSRGGMSRSGSLSGRDSSGDLVSYLQQTGSILALAEMLDGADDDVTDEDMRLLQEAASQRQLAHGHGGKVRVNSGPPAKAS
jgi:hypothetical protein